jgi:7,8-dihydropterin-6-yl-methyl-4-(beta-D-ribofuranosyl)aminobenzene 5'-phosphate synthase
VSKAAQAGSAVAAAAPAVRTAPRLVGGHGFSSGRIAEQSFEKLKSPSVMKLGMDHGSGCSAAGFTDAEQKLGTLPDQFNHEIATAFNLKDRGLIILTSCSHRGVVNAVRQAQEVSDVKKVHAIIGGFHLAPYPPEYLAQTLSALKEIGPDYLMPLHCSGEPFFEMAKGELGPKVIRGYTGTRLDFT